MGVSTNVINTSDALRDHAVVRLNYDLDLDLSVPMIFPSQYVELAKIEGINNFVFAVNPSMMDQRKGSFRCYVYEGDFWEKGLDFLFVMRTASGDERSVVLTLNFSSRLSSKRISHLRNVSASGVLYQSSYVSNPSSATAWANVHNGIFLLDMIPLSIGSAISGNQVNFSVSVPVSNVLCQANLSDGEASGFFDPTGFASSSSSSPSVSEKVFNFEVLKDGQRKAAVVKFVFEGQCDVEFELKDAKFRYGYVDGDMFSRMFCLDECEIEIFSAMEAFGLDNLKHLVFYVDDVAWYRGDFVSWERNELFFWTLRFLDKTNRLKSVKLRNDEGKLNLDQEVFKDFEADALWKHDLDSLNSLKLYRGMSMYFIANGTKADVVVRPTDKMRGVIRLGYFMDCLTRRLGMQAPSFQNSTYEKALLMGGVYSSSGRTFFKSVPFHDDLRYVYLNHYLLFGARSNSYHEVDDEVFWDQREKPETLFDSLRIVSEVLALNVIYDHAEDRFRIKCLDKAFKNSCKAILADDVKEFLGEKMDVFPGEEFSISGFYRTDADPESDATCLDLPMHDMANVLESFRATPSSDVKYPLLFVLSGNSRKVLGGAKPNFLERKNYDLRGRELLVPHAQHQSANFNLPVYESYKYFYPDSSSGTEQNSPFWRLNGCLSAIFAIDSQSFHSWANQSGAIGNVDAFYFVFFAKLNPSSLVSLKAKYQPTSNWNGFRSFCNVLYESFKSLLESDLELELVVKGWHSNKFPFIFNGRVYEAKEAHVNPSLDETRLILRRLKNLNASDVS